ncbi:hypothetical protein POTOM_015566 [Populus tomentosa]|uniref:Major facilitator superfamily (MFS) profile domain-containing protein n=1 Tax=Populus tomentosa TaxID=118781 RepID=A0A8X8D635_POPTO|nr:hypothetical protein POTOM_015566 [Populus tomentosa]
MAVAIPFFQQLTGMNVVMFYAPVLLQSIGFERNASLLSTVITGAVNILATGVSIYGSDKSGRRSLFLSGGAVMFVFQVPSEIFPLEIRSAGQSITVAVNMLFTFFIAQLFRNALPLQIWCGSNIGIGGDSRLKMMIAELRMSTWSRNIIF